MMGILDHVRGRVLARAGARFQARLDARVLRAILARAVSPAERTRPAMGPRDLEAIQRFASGNAPFAFFDAPWTPVFLCALFLFHWMSGLLAVFSGCLLLLLALLNQARTGRLQGELGEATARPARRRGSHAGPSASGKSTLARALAGVWRPAVGSVRLDGAELGQYGAALGRHIGYLPQEVVLFEGTVAENIENIARMDADAKDTDIVAAAKRTGAHEMILKLPDGYDFQVSAGGAALSGGQRQRIALARAFYGDPVLVVMDEPDSNLDAEGTMALARAVEAHKRQGGAAVIVAHRRGAFAQCDTVYVMEAGRPVPATSNRGKAPVRQLKTGGAATGDTPPQSKLEPPGDRDARVVPLSKNGSVRIARRVRNSETAPVDALELLSAASPPAGGREEEREGAS